jgi:hypothetical protein
MGKKIVDKDTGLVITYHLPQQHDAKYIVVVVDRGKTVEINHFGTLKESKRIFEEIAGDYKYRPSKINSSGRLDVSIWKWTENRYEKIDFHP